MDKNIGKKYNKLTIEYKTNQRMPDGQVVYECKCDCGRKKFTTALSLKKGSPASCGHYLCKSKYLNWVGKKIGYLTVKEITKYKYNYYFICECDCGLISKVNIDNFINGKTKSCGCKREELIIRTKRIIGSRKPTLEALVNKLYSSYYRNARKRGFEFNLSYDEFFNLINKECFYCSNIGSNTMVYLNTITLIYNGIDRRDSKISYTKENCVTCCCFCNRAKLDFSEDIFLNWLKNIKINLKTNKE